MNFFGFIMLAVMLFTTSTYWTTDKPDVRFTLSEKIPINFSTDKPLESVQQLEVKNVGTVQAEKIHVNLSGKISNAEIIKSSQTDKVDIVKSDNLVDVNYPELLPQRSFKMIIKSSGVDLTTRNVKISHSKGLATDALIKKDLGTVDLVFNFLGWIWILGFGWLILSQIHSYKIGELGNKAKSEKYNTILQMNKPFFVNALRWSTIRKEALSQKTIEDKYFTTTNNIENSLTYKTLTEVKPTYITDEEWKIVIEKSFDNFLQLVSPRLESLSYLNIDKIVSLLRLTKPQNVSSSVWTGFQEKLNQCFIFQKMLMIDNSYSVDKAFAELQSPKPTEIIEEYWKKYTLFLKQRIYKELALKIEFEREPILFLEKFPISQLDDALKFDLKKRAYTLAIKNLPTIDSHNSAQKFLEKGKPEWIKDDDYQKLLIQANAFLDASTIKSQFEKKNRMLELIAKCEKLPGRPSDIEIADWDKLVELQEKLTNAYQQLNEKEVLLSASEKDVRENKIAVNSMKERLGKQLDAIHSVFENPRDILRIENYDSPFAEGNFEAIKKMAHFMLEKGLKG